MKPDVDQRRRDVILGGVVLAAAGLVASLGRFRRRRGRRIVALARNALYERHDLAG